MARAVRLTPLRADLLASKFDQLPDDAIVNDRVAAMHQYSELDA